MPFDKYGTPRKFSGIGNLFSDVSVTKTRVAHGAPTYIPGAQCNTVNNMWHSSLPIQSASDVKINSTPNIDKLSHVTLLNDRLSVPHWVVYSNHFAIDQHHNYATAFIMWRPIFYGEIHTLKYSCSCIIMLLRLRSTLEETTYLVRFT